MPPLLLCVCVFQGEMSKKSNHLATEASFLDFTGSKYCHRLTFLKVVVKELQAFIPGCVGGTSIFGRGSGGLCLHVNEEGLCQDIA